VEPAVVETVMEYKSNVPEKNNIHIITITVIIAIVTNIITTMTTIMTILMPMIIAMIKR
jgi:hypothetical protein